MNSRYEKENVNQTICVITDTERFLPFCIEK